MANGLVLFKRWPRWRWRPKINEEIMPSDKRTTFSTFGDDFAVLDSELIPFFRDLDNSALQAQNQFRREQIILIGGSALAATIGAIQTALSTAALHSAADSARPWVGVVEAILAAALSAVAFRASTLQPQKRYFTHRLKAEMLRGEYFLFLGRLDPYANVADRKQHLMRRIAEIVAGEPNK
jgi:hypothetical protein